MQRFLLYLIITINIGFSFNLVGQTSPSFVRFDSPSFIPTRQNFNTSIVFKLDEPTSDIISIKFNKPRSLDIGTASLRLKSSDQNLDVNLSSTDRNEITITLDNSELQLEHNVLYQIILNCYSSKPIKFDKNEFLWINDDAEDLLKENNYPFEESRIYDIQNTAGKSLKLRNESSLKFDFSEEDEWENIYTEFWIKSENNLKECFSIEKASNFDTLISFSKNEFGFVAFPIQKNEDYRSDFYLGDATWNYVGILLAKQGTNVSITTYLNSVLVHSTFVENGFDLQELIFGFANSSSEATFEMDRLKIWKFNNSRDIAEKNKHFLSYDADSSQIIYQSNFENKGEFTAEYETNSLKIVSSNIDYSKSDAPIFSKAPKLTVNLGSTYNSIVWYVQEYSVAEEFLIERAVSDGEFQVVYKTLADDDPLKIYYFTDELINENEVAYYRVRQINADESEVFSAEIKIGNREIQEFNLSQNYPNPFNPITSIYVEIIIPADFEVNVYDLVGNNVSRLHDGFLAEGMHTFEFDGSKLPSGIYFYEVISPKAQIVKKMILAK